MSPMLPIGAHAASWLAYRASQVADVPDLGCAQSCQQLFHKDATLPRPFTVI